MVPTAEERGGGMRSTSQPRRRIRVQKPVLLLVSCLPAASYVTWLRGHTCFFTLIFTPWLESWSKRAAEMIPFQRDFEKYCSMSLVQGKRKSSKLDCHERLPLCKKIPVRDIGSDVCDGARLYKMQLTTSGKPFHVYHFHV